MTDQPLIFEKRPDGVAVLRLNRPDIHNAFDDRLIAELSAQGGARFDPHSRAIALWSMVHGYVSMRIEGNLLAGKDKVTGEPREAAIVSAMLRGIGV